MVLSNALQSQKELVSLVITQPLMGVEPVECMEPAKKNPLSEGKPTPGSFMVNEV
jgi:hypothetical protein